MLTSGKQVRQLTLTVNFVASSKASWLAHCLISDRLAFWPVTTGHSRCFFHLGIMANPALLQKKNGKYLWFSLLGLGFQPDTAASSVAGKTNINVKHLNLGPNMFDKPNKDAFYIVTHYLLEKLNPTRFHEAYRHCWPVLNHKADAEFRKVTCTWLREIMDETANAGSKVVASLFLSPGGPKFVSLMLHLANHVMLQEMKTFTTDNSWVPEAAAMPASSMDMAVKRLNLIKTRFLKTAVDQDHFLREYQRRAQLLVKSMKDIRAEGTKYDELLKCHSSDSAQEGASPAEKTQKVRSLWSAIDEMLSTTKEEQNAVESVLKGDVDKYTLDGTDRVLKIPRTLLERIEQLPHQLSSGNVYEAGQLNLLCVLELMNHALQILREERCRVSHAPKLQLSAQHLQEKCQQMARALQDLHLIRQKISKEEIPEVRSTIRELEAQWDRKWMDILKDTPLVSFLNEDPALGFLSPMAPLSFKPLAEASHKSSVFAQYPAKLLEEKSAESKSQEGINPNDSELKSPCPAMAERTESPVVTTEASSRANTSLDWLFDTPPSPPLRAPPVPPPQPSVRKTTHVHPKVAPIRTKTQILHMECDNLADQFADAVTTTTPTEGRVKGLDLEGLLSTLHGDPFSTRKQLPRTPESLIMDVKSSWRKAVEEDKVEKIRRTAKANDSITGWLNSSEQPHDVLLNSDALSCSITPTAANHSSPPVNQQAVLLKSTLLWDTFNTEALDSPSGTGSSAVQFSLDHETLPEMPSCDSLLSLNDESLDMKSEEEEELLIPALKTEAKQSPLNMAYHGQTQQECDVGSFIESRKRTPECLLSGHVVSGVDRDWLTEPAKSVEASDKVFSLDLDRLGTPSPPKKEEYSLPKLITFSPIDDMKC
ncbi:HAUS augmin-like complex subunit 6 isoform X2 [Toxotes jaculatrix]|uniref:HAUS augmin-like complex subunit 6 isoform X2 n=1 Tax=Toxotes jaculatrix TaxID=941984 RepID=UPI001B3AE0F2|nr:HAUS augmin-like complex subunit 6 isoform X2 [Toxotes jaculatrix]